MTPTLYTRRARERRAEAFAATLAQYADRAWALYRAALDAELRGGGDTSTTWARHHLYTRVARGLARLKAWVGGGV